MGALTVLGKNSKTTFLAIPDDFINIEFEATATLKDGQPVKLNTAGKLVAWAKTDALTLLIGYVYAPNQGTVANGELCTVLTRGRALIYAMASADIDCGLGTWSSYDSSTEADGGATNDLDGNTGFNVFEQAGSNTACAWILDNPAGAGDIIRVLLM